MTYEVQKQGGYQVRFSLGGLKMWTKEGKRVYETKTSCASFGIWWMGIEGEWTSLPATVSITSNFVTLTSFTSVILSGRLASMMPNALTGQGSHILTCLASPSKCLTLPSWFMIFSTDSSEKPPAIFWKNMLAPAS